MHIVDLPPTPGSEGMDCTCSWDWGGGDNLTGGIEPWIIVPKGSAGKVLALGLELTVFKVQAYCCYCSEVLTGITYKELVLLVFLPVLGFHQSCDQNKNRNHSMKKVKSLRYDR